MNLILVSQAGDMPGVAATEFDAACIKHCLDSGGRAYVVSRSEVPYAFRNIEAPPLASAISDYVAPISGDDDASTIHAVESILRDVTGPFIIQYSGVTTNHDDFFSDWLPRASALATDRVVAPPLFDPIACVQLNGFNFVLPEMYPVWSCLKVDSRPEALALPCLVADGRGKLVLADALRSVYPYSYCALALSLKAWVLEIELLCEPGTALEIAPPPPRFMGLDCPSLQFALMYQRLETWCSIWGYETMLIEATRLASVHPNDVDAVLNHIQCGCADAIAGGTPHTLADSIGDARRLDDNLSLTSIYPQSPLRHL